MANFVKCSNGHDFDLSIFRLCPFCGAPAMISPGYGQPSAQMYQQMPPRQTSPQPMPYQPMVPTPPIPPQPPMPPSRTMPDSQAKPQGERNVNPTVGWLVCTDGSCYGKTYPLREERNFIGSTDTMDIVLGEDKSVSGELHAVITYVPKQGRFVAQQGASRSLYYVNGEAVLENTALKADDIIEIGKSKFRFVPLCGNEFDWETYKNS